jgi:hypothetical protein
MKRSREGQEAAQGSAHSYYPRRFDYPQGHGLRAAFELALVRGTEAMNEEGREEDCGAKAECEE